MRIGLISWEYPPDTALGGIATYTSELAHGLSALGHQVVVLARALQREELVQDGPVLVYRLLPWGDPSPWPILWRLNRVWEGHRLAVLRKLLTVVHKHRLEVLEAPEIRAEALGYCFWPARVPLVVKLHTPSRLLDELAGRKPDLRRQLEYRLESLQLRRASLVTSCSAALVERCRGWLPRPESITVVPNPIRLPEPRAAAEPLPDEVVFVGRLEWRKGVQLLAEVVPQVLARHPHTRFRLLGPDSAFAGGPSLANYLLERLPPDARSAVELAGALPREAVLSCLARRPIGLFPSLWENFPYACLEAMAHGCAVVASRRGGMAEMLVPGRSGALVEPEPSALAGALCGLLADPARRRQVGDAARRRVQERFSAPAVARASVAVYARAIAAHRGRR